MDKRRKSRKTSGLTCEKASSEIAKRTNTGPVNITTTPINNEAGSHRVDEAGVGDWVRHTEKGVCYKGFQRNTTIRGKNSAKKKRISEKPVCTTGTKSIYQM